MKGWILFFHTQRWKCKMLRFGVFFSSRFVWFCTCTNIITANYSGRLHFYKLSTTFSFLTSLLSEN